MSTRREQILAQIATQLGTISGVGGRIYRSRVEPLARGESPAIVVEPRQDQAQQTVIPRIDWTLSVSVAVIVRHAVPDQAADSIVANVHAKMMLDQTLGGISQAIEPVGVSFDLIEADQPAGVITCDYNVRYQTSLIDQTTL